MNKNLLALSLLTGILHAGFCQLPTQLLLYPGIAQEGKCIIRSVTNGYYLASNLTDSSGSKSILITRLDDQLSIVWNKTIHATGTGERVNTICQDSTGSIFIAGYTEDSTAVPLRNVLVIKTDSAANVTWKNVFNYFTFKSDAIRLFPSPGGSVYVVGNSFDIYAGTMTQCMTMIMKLSSSGTLLWARTFNTGVHSNAATDALLANDGKILLVGVNYGLNTLRLGSTKVDTTGILTWDKRFTVSPTSSFPVGIVEAMAPAENGAFVYFGNQLYSSSNSPLNFSMKCDSAGNPTWHTSYGITLSSYNSGLQNIRAVATSDSGFAFAGTLYMYFSGNTAPVLMKLNKQLNPEWCRYYDTTSVNTINTLIQTSDGGYMFAGKQNGKIILVKTDSLGNNNCSNTAQVFFTFESLPAPTAFLGAQIPSFQPTSYNPVTISMPANATDTGCTATGLSDVSQALNTFRIYPNPVEELFYFPEIQNALYYSINDINGKIISKGTIQPAQAYINVSGLIKGFYLLSISNEKMQMVGKFVKK